jgi:membrane protein required for colicin V production
MNSFDVLVAVIICFCLIRGIFRGLIKEVSSIIGVLAGYYAGYTYYLYLAKFLSKWLSVPAYSKLISFLIIFCGIFIIISILGVIIKYLLSISFLGWVDRICGGGFGLIKGLLIASILFIVFTTFLPKNAPFVKNSLIAPHLSYVSTNMAKIVHKDMRLEFVDKIEGLKKAWKKKR